MVKPSTSSPSNWLDVFVAKNSWPMIVALIGLIVWSVTLYAQVQITVQKVQAAEEKITEVQRLVERVIVLEEKDKGIASDISEIKDDIKLIQQTLGVR